MSKRTTGKESVRTAGAAKEKRETPKKTTRTDDQRLRKSTPGTDTGTGIKTYVLDTNVLLHNPTALFVFEENTVVVPFAVLEELDTFKGENNDLGRNARQ
jgi:hypothetical protein